MGQKRKWGGGRKGEPASPEAQAMLTPDPKARPKCTLSKTHMLPQESLEQSLWGPLPLSTPVDTQNINCPCPSKENLLC
jgi:hypothetical protein